jgi:4-hydroxythreonine-4-phosphate dehydrogenase
MCSIAPLALTMGDPAGIGLDIALAAFARRDAVPLPPFVFIGDPVALEARARVLGLSVPIDVVQAIPASGTLPADCLSVLEVRLAVPAVAGKPDPENANAVIEAIELAARETVAGHASAMVTNPISKATLYASGFAYPGHTEFLGVLSAKLVPGQPSSPVMMLASDELRVVPLTVHVPLASVPAAVTVDRILEVCRITAHDLRSRFGIETPRLAVAGLNPHAGEAGTIGREDVDIIVPALEILRAEGLSITGPHSADTLFHAAARSRYDVAICMYHDQALIPIKTLAFDTGVNVTLGLGFSRTSPDHGTAFDIAGSGRANSTSLVAALRMAARLAGPSVAPACAVSP